MAEEHVHTAAFRGARFRAADLSGASFRDCDLSGVRIASSMVAGLRVDGFDGQARGVLVDGVDVTKYVMAELDRRHPERVAWRAMRTADDHRTVWATVERLWDGTLARAERLPEPARHERVDGEWSFVETLRHLVLATDTWVGRMVLGDDGPHHPLALPPTDFPPGAVAGPDEEPSYDEVLAVYAERRARIGEVLRDLTDGLLAEPRTGELAPGEVETCSVAHALRVVIREHVEHRRFAERDLAVLEAR